MPVSATTSPYSLLVNEAGRHVSLTIKSGARKARTIVVKTMATDQMLRYRAMVEYNRAAVHKATGGKVGYVHVPNMGPWGYSEFHRYYAREVERDGLIVDVRNNGGGHVSQLILEKLLRRRIGGDRTRWMDTMYYPEAAPRGAVVAITNEYAGSDGDIFSHSFKLYGLGPLVGRRTWGGVVGIWPRHALVDGTVTSQPEFAYWFDDVGFDVENYGTDPDVPVDNLPQDYAKGRDPQLQAGLGEVRKLLKKLPPLPKMSPVPSMKPPKLPKRR